MHDVQRDDKTVFLRDPKGNSKSLLKKNMWKISGFQYTVHVTQRRHARDCPSGFPHSYKPAVN